MNDKIKMEIAVSRLQEAISESQEFVASANDRNTGSGAVDYAIQAGALEGWIEVLQSRMQGIVAILNMEQES
jgi:hypothetical protein